MRIKHGDSSPIMQQWIDDTDTVWTPWHTWSSNYNVSLRLGRLRKHGYFALQLSLPHTVAIRLAVPYDECARDENLVALMDAAPRFVSRLGATFSMKARRSKGRILLMDRPFQLKTLDNTIKKHQKRSVVNPTAYSLISTDALLDAIISPNVSVDIGCSPTVQHIGRDVMCLVDASRDGVADHKIHSRMSRRWRAINSNKRTRRNIDSIAHLFR